MFFNWIMVFQFYPTTVVPMISSWRRCKGTCKSSCWWRMCDPWTEKPSCWNRTQSSPAVMNWCTSCTWDDIHTYFISDNYAYHLISTALRSLLPFPSTKHSTIITTFSASNNSSYLLWYNASSSTIDEYSFRSFKFTFFTRFPPFPSYEKTQTYAYFLVKEPSWQRRANL